MDSLLLSMQGAVSQGVLWGIMALGVFLTFRILDIADMTVDGSFTTGACVCATLILNFHWHPIPATIAAVLAGAAAGAITGVLHTCFQIPAILAGILTQLGLWSINLRIMLGKPNLTLANSDSLFSWLLNVSGWKNSTVSLILGIVVVAVIVLLLYWFFGTEVGASIRATGNNEDMIRALGVSTTFTKILGLTVSNALVGLSGALVCQSQKYSDIQSGVGAIVIGLAAIIIGEMLFGWIKWRPLQSFAGKMLVVVLGTVAYFIVRAVVLWLGMDANDMKLMSALIVILALCIPVLVDRWKARRAYTEGGGLGC